METTTIKLTTEELELTDYEIDMVLLENQLKDNKLRTKNKLIKLLKKLFGGNL